MTVELINSTNYANIYGLYDSMGKPIGTKEVILSGRYAGTNYYSLTSKTNAEIKKLFQQVESQA